MSRGTVYKIKGCRNWYLSYHGHDGKRHVESSKSPRKNDALNILDKRIGALANGENVTAALAKLTFDDSAADIETNYKIKGRKSLDELQRRIKLHLRPFFGSARRMSTITSADVEAFIAKRQADTIRTCKEYSVKREDGTVEVIPEERRPVSAAEINRELTVLRRMFRIAEKNRGLRHRPHIELLAERQPRQGFFNRAEIDEVCKHLPAELVAVVMFGFHTAWRANEVLGLEWSHVSFEGRGRVWLDGDQTKNGEPRVFKMTTELRTILEGQQRERERLQKQGRIVATVFHRQRLVKQSDGSWKMEEGQPILSFVKAWRAACTAAGYPGRIFHDLRRSAIRNFVRAGIGEQIAMALSGHKTSDVFRRYNITAEEDLDAAADRLDMAAQPEKQATEKSRGRVKAFRRR